MGFWDSFTGGLGNIASGIGGFFTGGGRGNPADAGFNIPNIAGKLGQGINTMGGMFGNTAQSFGSNLFGGQQGNRGNIFQRTNTPVPSQLNPAQLQYQQKLDPTGGGGPEGIGLNNGFFGRHPLLTGLGTVFGSQLIPNKQPPQLPPSFYAFQQQAQAGGPPIQQQSNQYLSTLMSGQNTAANDAATHSLDINYQEQLRQLNGMYKSLRPGTDPTTDTTYQRDLSLLNDQYSRARAQVLAQQQMGAAQQGIGAGQAAASQQQAAIEAEISRLNAQYQAAQQQRQGFRDTLGGLGSSVATLGALQKLFPNFGSRY